MQIYARIDDSVVVETIEGMADGEGNEIPIEDRFHPDIIAALVDITNTTPAPGQGWAYDGKAFTAPAAEPAPTPSQLASAALAAGLSIVSTGTPTLNGTFAVDPLSQMDIIAIETSLNAGKGFPGSATVFNYADMPGVMHPFTEANFTDFAAAVRDYVYALKSVIAGAASVLPPATSTIA